MQSHFAHSGRGDLQAEKVGGSGENTATATEAMYQSIFKNPHKQESDA